MKIYKNVDEYIKHSNKEHKLKLIEVRNIIKENISEIDESISYGMPAYKFKNKPLFYFAEMKGHLGIYPTSGPIKTLEKDLKKYNTTKGCIRIPWTEKIPKNLIIKLIKTRKKEILQELK